MVKYELIFHTDYTLISNLIESWYDDVGLLFRHLKSNLVPYRESLIHEHLFAFDIWHKVM